MDPDNIFMCPLSGDYSLSPPLLMVLSITDLMDSRDAALRQLGQVLSAAVRFFLLQ